MRLSLFKPGPQVAAEVMAAMPVRDARGRDVSRLPIVSPFSPESNLAQWIADDVLGEAAAARINSRGSAMRLSGVARGRNLVVTSISRNPLVVFRGPPLHAITSDDESKIQRLDVQPSWTMETNDGSSPEIRNAWLVDDLMFYGWTLLRSRRSASTGFPLASDHIAYDDWFVDDDNRLNVGGLPVPFNEEANWTLIPGLHEGILAFGGDVLNDARAIARLVRDRLENRTPDVNLEAQPDAEDLDGAEMQAFVADYLRVRKLNGGVGYTNRYVKAVPFRGRSDSDLMIEARNAAVVDLARIIGVHAGMLDATAPKASLNYETQTGRNREFVDLDLWSYMLPIAARLSMPDFTPRGQRAAFDLFELTDLPTSTPAATAPEEPAP